jgi:DNA-binding response OmpR family regulator
MFGWRKKTIADVSVKLPLSELRKRARILVVDDDLTAFPHKLLQKEGYNVTYWKSVENVRELENGEYDIIVLDIHGIARAEVSGTGGLGILSHIKKYNPAQIIIAYSGQKYDLKHADFWNIADDYLGKPSSLLDCKQKIDSLLERKFTANYYAEVLRTLLRENGVDEKRIKKLEKLVAAQKDKTADVSPDVIARITGIAKDVASAAGVIVGVIVRLLHHSPT